MYSTMPFPRILLGPGPSSVSPRVLEALARPPIGYLDPDLFEALAEIQVSLREVFGTRNAFTIATTGTGMAGMESCFANLVEPGDRVLVGIHGFFGGRMAEIAERFGAEVTRVECEWGDPLDIERLSDAAKQLGDIKIVACVHAETSTGVRQPLEPVAALARRHNALFVADTVTSLGGIPVEADKVGIDAAYSGTQKCMGCPPGLSPITVSDRAMQVAKARKSRVVSWYQDWSLIEKYWGVDHLYHHTVPGNLLMGFREALRQIAEEGLESRFQRHRDVSAVLMDGLAERGIEPFAADGYRLPTLNSVRVPEGADDIAIRGRLLREYGLEIGGGLGALKGKVWRIGTMGESATIRNVTLLLGALDRLLV